MCVSSLATVFNSRFVLNCFLLGMNKLVGAIKDGKFPMRALSWFIFLVAGLQPRRTRLDPTSVHVRYMVDKVALGEGFVPALSFPLSLSFLLYSTGYASGI